jgi:ATP-dependent helicase HrpA
LKCVIVPIEQKEEADETSDDLQNAILDAVDELYRIYAAIY